MPTTANASTLEIVLTAMCAVLLVTSLANGVVIVYRGVHARLDLEAEGRGDEWGGELQKVFWQRIALVTFFILKGALLTLLGLKLMGTPPLPSVNSDVTMLFTIETITLAVYATAYQVVILLMRPGLDEDIVEAGYGRNRR